MSENEVAASVIDAALKVHRTFGPGLLESVYEAALTLELRKRGFTVEVQKAILSTRARNRAAASAPT